jgi:hypothetical protein
VDTDERLLSAPGISNRGRTISITLQGFKPFRNRSPSAPNSNRSGFTLGSGGCAERWGEGDRRLIATKPPPSTGNVTNVEITTIPPQEK